MHDPNSDSTASLHEPEHPHLRSPSPRAWRPDFPGAARGRVGWASTEPPLAPQPSPVQGPSHRAPIHHQGICLGPVLNPGGLGRGDWPGEVTWTRDPQINLRLCRPPAASQASQVPKTQSQRGQHHRWSLSTASLLVWGPRRCEGCLAALHRVAKGRKTEAELSGSSGL